MLLRRLTFFLIPVSLGRRISFAFASASAVCTFLTALTGGAPAGGVAAFDFNIDFCLESDFFFFFAARISFETGGGPGGRLPGTIPARIPGGDVLLGVDSAVACAFVSAAAAGERSLAPSPCFSLFRLAISKEARVADGSWGGIPTGSFVATPISCVSLSVKLGEATGDSPRARVAAGAPRGGESPVAPRVGGGPRLGGPRPAGGAPRAATGGDLPR